MLGAAPPSFLRVGHGGASGVVRGNTLASFDAALDLGVDAIEFDVRAWDGALVLAHTLLHARWTACAGLEAALTHLAAPRFAAVGLILDLKHVGCEARVVDALHRHGLIERALVASQVPAVVDRCKELEPRLRVGISIGGRLARRSRRWRDWRGQVLDRLADARWDALMAQHRLVDAALVAEVRAREAPLYAWTVNDREHIDRLRTLAVDGIVTADPRLFGQPVPRVRAQA